MVPAPLFRLALVVSLLTATAPAANAQVFCEPGVSGVMVVASLAVLFAVLLSPPPLTVAVLVTLDGALLATFTVTVMSG